MENSGIQLNMDIANISIINGNVKSISKGDSGEYLTRIDMILPFNSDELPCNKYEVKYEKGSVEVIIRLIKDKSSDPLLSLCKNFQMGTPSQSGLPEMLPFEIFTDNRGKYPALLASILFPYRIASWIDDSHESGMKMDHDYETIQVTGSPDNQEKIKAIIIVNRLLSLLGLPNGRKLKYEDITVFSETYFKKGNYSPVLIKINALVSKDAYKDAVEEYYLSSFGKAEIQKSIIKVQDFSRGKDLSNEKALFDVVNETIEVFLVHYIENRRWIEPFWDGERKVRIKDEEHVIPRIPKKETKIQPTLQVIFDIALRPLGIHVLRESDEGVGRLDFRFLYTNKNNTPISVAVEFKIAHHKKIKHGITRQLPAYLRSIRSKHGSFVVMWFKDNKYFKKPENRNLKQMTEWLIEEAEKISEELDITILPKVINASIQPSASNE